jgi:hypothetical protein
MPRRPSDLFIDCNFPPYCLECCSLNHFMYMWTDPFINTLCRGARAGEPHRTRCAAEPLGVLVCGMPHWSWIPEAMQSALHALRPGWFWARSPD